MKKTAIFAMAVALCFTFTVGAYAAENNAIGKLTRGVMNAGFGWVEFFGALKSEGGRGLGTGIVNSVKRELVGAVEIVTFPIGVPNEDFSPLIEPESPFDSWK
ncbi:MAG: hypothetical protein A3G34_02725 [Candidatus Lindowbacteria bacterium RIFCSPLOWO2_12_FULL_62_27]|nr:MAG: hypothetical protein A3G34_02725 [Candidatus Lindowbacteria bacterium RIFCSPLOWO2_12_FULL_62_27]OGH63359.1 MAG: hypothetical protein A3I06_09000 [Candidatus Lindowbacteria bacterium RIFCSPLOWO2_02_FULL_62_12]